MEILFESGSTPSSKSTNRRTTEVKKEGKSQMLETKEGGKGRYGFVSMLVRWLGCIALFAS